MKVDGIGWLSTLQHASSMDVKQGALMSLVPQVDFCSLHDILAGHALSVPSRR